MSHPEYDSIANMRSSKKYMQLTFTKQKPDINNVSLVHALSDIAGVQDMGMGTNVVKMRESHNISM